MPLFGLFAALVLSAAAFELVGMKADLGALIVGMLLAKHARAGEVSDSILSLKDIFLVGFFLNIGLSGVPSLGAVILALILVLVLPFKVALFFALLTRFRLRARSAGLAALSLATYSEFGLIVGAIGVSNGWIPADWLTVIALALSFVLGSPLNAMAHRLYARFHASLLSLETAQRHPEDLPIKVGGATVAVLGMGRVGAGAFHYIDDELDDQVIGLDSNPDVVAAHVAAGGNVVQGDVTDTDFWARLRPGRIRLVMLTLPDLSANLEVLQFLGKYGFDGRVSVVARYEDEIEQLQAAGADAVYDSYAEAGAGFAGRVLARFPMPGPAPSAD